MPTRRFGLAALTAALTISCFAAGSPSAAAVLTENGRVVFSGSLASDDGVAFHNLTASAPFALDVAFESFSYAGGRLRDGTVVASGGFDPVISLFDSSDRLIGFADDGLRRPDPASRDPYDAYLQLRLEPGDYRLAVTQYDNYPNARIGGFLAAGFQRDGDGNFTSDRCDAGAFCDAGGFSRSPDYLLEVATLSSIPLPGGLFLLGGAFAVLGVFGRKQRVSA